MASSMKSSPGSSQPKDLRPLILCGPACLEKDAVARKLIADHPESFMFPVPYTTDSPVPGQPFSAYHVSRAEFDNMVADESFAVHKRYGDFCIGTSKQALTAGAASNRVVMMDVVQEGFRQLKALPGFNARYVYIIPPPLSLAQSRISTAQSLTEEVRFREPLRRCLVDIGYRDYGLGEAAETDYARNPEVHDLRISSRDLNEMYRALVGFVFS